MEEKNNFKRRFRHLICNRWVGFEHRSASNFNRRCVTRDQVHAQPTELRSG